MRRQLSCNRPSRRWATDGRGLTCTTPLPLFDSESEAVCPSSLGTCCRLLTGGFAIKRAKHRVPWQRRKCYVRNPEACFLTSTKCDLCESPLERVGGVPKVSLPSGYLLVLVMGKFPRLSGELPEAVLTTLHKLQLPP
ncbi:hypothetical protein PIB30_023391 [Stylosanthes scabra]|uniref:Uncharacterized protein n=1 Tax=Stylosanthes scabra TaxID=79078 RepID=A0ABU6WCH7_9FABA|nr:hypothetical protein [Stylosanthes scabra]